MKKEEKLKVIELRSQGMSVNRIADEVKVSKSTVSLWVRDIVLTDKQKQQLKDNIPKVGPRKKGDISKRRKEMGEKKWAEYQKERERNKTLVWRKNNPEKYVNRDQNIKIRLIEEKGSKCEKCDYNKCIGSLDFHHKDPSKKEFTISHNHKSYKKMKKETDKCFLWCSNCHREFHWKENDIKRSERIKKLKQLPACPNDQVSLCKSE